MDPTIEDGQVFQAQLTLSHSEFMEWFARGVNPSDGHTGDSNCVMRKVYIIRQLARCLIVQRGLRERNASAQSFGNHENTQIKDYSVTVELH